MSVIYILTAFLVRKTRNLCSQHSFKYVTCCRYVWSPHSTSEFQNLLIPLYWNLRYHFTNTFSLPSSLATLTLPLAFMTWTFLDCIMWDQTVFAFMCLNIFQIHSCSKLKDLRMNLCVFNHIFFYPNVQGNYSEVLHLYFLECLKLKIDNISVRTCRIRTLIADGSENWQLLMKLNF